MNTSSDHQPSQNWDDLKDKIAASQNFPSVYMFKFILSSDNKKIAQIEALFDNTDNPEISIHPSSRGRYVSITIKQMVQNVEYIIHIYKQVAKIPGVIMI
ncbi:MAG: DUF493 domain-containing protein [Bacteroidetes bacterium]|jgi:putative lipoic acid-binding regulatory protein|nr:MAG: DUF493 domain-containing protein [Bacteroidota bacterium]